MSSSVSEPKSAAGVKSIDGLFNVLFGSPDNIKWFASNVPSHDSYSTPKIVDDQKPGLGYGKVLENMPLDKSTGVSFSSKGFVYTVFKSKEGKVVLFRDKILPKVSEEFDYSGLSDTRYATHDYRKANDSAEDAAADKADNDDHFDVPF